MKTTKSIFLTLLFSLILCVSSTGCKDTKTYRIGISQCSDDDWRKKMNEEILREAMFHDDISVEIRSADDNSEKQIADLDYFVENDFDIIIVAPNEADALTPKIDEIYSSGIPVILFDRSINGDSYTAFQGADNKQIGKLAATLAYTMCGKGAKVIEIYGLEGSTPAEHRREGFDLKAAELGLDIVAAAHGDWTADKAYVVADSLLRNYSNVDIIYAHNDRMAIAASEVADKLGLKDVKLIGIDAAPAIGIQAVADSVIDATFLYPTNGQQLIRTAINILTGQPYTRDLILPTTTAVNYDAAEMLLLQDQALREETAKLESLKSQFDIYWEKHTLQTAIMYIIVVITILLAIMLFLLLRAYWSNKRHRKEIESQNAELARQRDELDSLYNQLQEATGSKLTFFTNVSHDLRTPLTLIADPVNQLAEAGNLNSQQHTLMQIANKNVKILMRLVNQILDIRKFDNNHLKINLENVDLAKAISEWAEVFAAAAKKRHVKLATDITPGADYVTAVDIEKIERVIFNMISNAFKFTPENGEINISLRRLDDKISLAISDTGCGINKSEIQHIFDRFFMNDRINPTGSGIGLALTKVFVEMHGGSIDVESEIGKGSVFTVTIPVNKLDQPIADVSKSAQVAEQDIAEFTLIEDNPVEISEESSTVLVIDDNEDICTLIKSHLSDKYTVIQAHSGTSGIRLANKYIPDLIICDVMMPGINGYETCRRIKGEVVTSHIPVLLLTACSRDEQRIEAYECGADGYMSKPFDAKMLLSRCESLIKNRELIYSKDPVTGIIDAKISKSAAPKNELDSEFYDKFVEVVEDGMGNSDLSVEDIADKIGMSRVQMYRKLKALTNYSPAELLRNIRLKRASILLKTTEATISEVAYAVGFSSPSYFTKCYKDYFGEAPSDVQNRTSKRR